MTRGSRIVRNVVAALLLLAGIALLAGWWIVRRSLPALDGQVAVAGLKAGVIVDRDQWGRPWIRAKSTDDLVMAQGYVMAQDRSVADGFAAAGGGGRLVRNCGAGGAEV